MGVNAICKRVEALLREKEGPVLVSIEGGAGSGKTTLAHALQKALGGNLYHMDDFFLPPEKRTPERLRAPGGNVDYERFFDEVVRGIAQGKPFSYGRFDCSVGGIVETRMAPLARLHIIEGVYSAHPFYGEIYDLRIFIELDAERQRDRILSRDFARADMFFTRWIPMENAYFEAFDIKGKSDIIVE